MNKKNLIQFAQSLIFLPVVASPVSLGNIIKDNAKENIQTVFMQKENIAGGLLSFNQDIDLKAKDLKDKLILAKAKADAIDSYFKKHDMPLEGMGKKMVEEAEKNELDWRLLPAISVRESTGGKFDCIKVTYNPFGWGSCKIGFSSNEKAIEIVAKNLGGNNPNTARHYDNKDTKEILRAYNPPSIVPRYVEQVISIMNEIGDKDLNIKEL